MLLVTEMVLTVKDSNVYKCIWLDFSVTSYSCFDKFKSDVCWIMTRYIQLQKIKMEKINRNAVDSSLKKLENELKVSRIC